MNSRGKWNLWAAVGVVVVALAVFAAVWFQSRERPEETFSRGWQALAAGDFPKVRRSAKALDAWPAFRPHGHLLFAGALVRQGQPGAAIRELEQAAECLEVRLQVLTLSAEAYFHLGRFEDAVKMSQLALDRDPHSPEALWWAGAACFKLKDPLRAAPLFLRLTEETPDDPRPHRVLGRIRREQSAQQALPHYRAALKGRLPEHERQAVILELAETQSELADFQGALQTLAEAEPSLQAHMLRARCENDLGRTKAALEHAGEAVRLAPDDAEALMLLGQLRLAQSDVPGALEVLKEAAARRPRSSLVQYALLQAYTRMGDTQSAARAEQAMKAAHKLDSAYFQAQLAATKNAGDVDSRVRVGELAEQLGKVADARDWFEAALSIDPARKDVQAALNRLSRIP